MKSLKLFKSNFLILYLVIACISIIGASGCQRKKNEITRFPVNQQSNGITNLELKVRRLEQIIEEKLKQPVKSDNKTPIGRIKSLTFRIGTKDDRLRIYWEDGSKSDLPCTKEQYIWACG